MSYYLKPGDELLLNSLLEEQAKEPACSDTNTCELHSIIDILEKTKILGSDNQVAVTIYMMANGLIPLLANFFLLGLKFAALQTGTRELERMYGILDTEDNV